MDRYNVWGNYRKRLKITEVLAWNNEKREGGGDIINLV
jgi:hypothetical protein